jgi:lipoprotein-anchoring transpeptidase ErfK/SrfK
MRLKLIVAGLCVVALGWPAVAGAQTTTTSDPATTTTTVPVTTTTVPPPAPAPPAGPTADQIAAFLRLLVPANTGSGRRIIYSVTGQRVWLVDDNNELVKSYKVSGRVNTPLRGVYRVYSKSLNASSGSARMRFMIRFAHGHNLPIGFHSIPTIRGKPMQSESQLGTYQSHGCVRQAVPDAFYLWLWAPVGTLVVVI